MARAVLAFLLVWPFAACAAEQAPAARVLVVPSTPPPAPPTFTASLDGEAIPVVSTEPAATVPVVVIVDASLPLSGATPRALLELHAALGELMDRYRAIVLLRNAPWLPGFERLEIAPGKLIAVAAAPNGNDAGKASAYAGASFVTGSSATELVYAIARAYTGSGPVRVFWVSSDFRFVPSYRNELFGSESLFAYIAPGQGPPMDALSASGIVFFPVYVPESGAERQKELSAGAHTLASLSGGFLSTATETPGVALLSAVHKTDAGFVLGLAVSATTRRNGDEPRVLEVRGAGTNTRRFSLPPASRPVTANESALLSHTVPIIRASDQLRFASGCGADALRLVLPPAVIQASQGELAVWIRYVNAPPGTLNQRMALRRAEAHGRDWLCVPVMTRDPGISFHLFVWERNLRWLGALRGTFESPRPSGDSKQHQR